MQKRLLAILLLAIPIGASAKLARVEITEKSDVLNGVSFGSVGPYVRLVGKLHFTADPHLPANRLVTDIGYAPRNKAGQVEYAADFYALVPKDPSRGNGTVLYEVSNRGRKGILNVFQFGSGSLDPRTAKEFGDGFLMERGFSLFFMGWQFDVPPEPNLLRFFAPVARDGDQAIGGVVRSDYVPDADVTTIHLADRTHIPYRVVDPDDARVQLTVRDRAYGPRTTIPRSQWKFENGTHIYMADKFRKGRIYEVVYRSQNPPVAGLGLAATRDLISFLKYGGKEGELGFLRPHLKRAITYGSSQSGRFLRKFLYDGFNLDESGKLVFDGVWANVAGAGRGSFNHRFAQPSRDARPHFNFLYPTDVFPFTDSDQTDPETGRTEGILTRAKRTKAVPRIFYTNHSYEYYGRSASLIHTTIDGARDLAPEPNTRIYLIAGAQHASGSLPPKRDGLQQLSNSNDIRWVSRALLQALNAWVTDGTEPPASQYPKIAEGQLVPLSSLRFPALPGVNRPQRMHTPRRMDFGPEFLSTGLVTIEPPKLGKEFPTLVPQVDEDGNEMSGIRLPVVQVPLTTLTGWNLRDPSIGAPDELYSMVGSTLPFPWTREEQQRTKDPRKPVEARYKDRDDYLNRIRKAAKELASGGYVLAADVEGITQQAGAHWDHWSKR